MRSTAIGSLLLVGAVAIADFIAHGALLGPWGPYILAYTLLSVNVDFFESYWIAKQHTRLAFIYSSSRLILRLLIAVLIAYFTEDVRTIIYSLIALEFVRILVGLRIWRSLVRPEDPPRPGLAKQQRDYCLPLTISMTVGTFNKNIGNVLIARMIGPEALALYSVSTYAVPILYVLRNSVSEALLPKLAGEASAEGRAPNLALWSRTNALFAIILVPIGVLLARYAELTINTLFSEKYLAAVPLFQVFLISLITDTVDFGVSFRLLNITRKFVRGYVIGMVLNLTTLVILLPRIGPMAASIALMAGQFFAMFYFGYVQSRVTGMSYARTLGLPVFFRVAVASVCAAPLLFIPVSDGAIDILIAAASAAVFLAVYLAVLWAIGKGDARDLLQDAKDRAFQLLRLTPHVSVGAKVRSGWELLSGASIRPDWWTEWGSLAEAGFAARPGLCALMAMLLVRSFGRSDLVFATLRQGGDACAKLLLQRASFGRWQIFTRRRRWSLPSCSSATSPCRAPCAR